MEVREHFSVSQAALIAAVAFALVGATWMKDPQALVNAKNFIASAISHSSATTSGTAKQKTARYISFEERYGKVSNMPQVAGAQTSVPMPSIINEDGGITPAIDMNVESAQVLGAQTSIDAQTASSEPSQPVVATGISPRGEQVDPADEISTYVNAVTPVEQDYFSTGRFESALKSQNADMLQSEILYIQNIVSGLQNIHAPESLAQLHEDKIANYIAAQDLLEKVKHKDQPQAVIDSFERFSATAQKLQDDSILAGVALTKLFSE